MLDSEPQPSNGPVPRRSWAVLAVVIALAAIIRAPAIEQNWAGWDEEFFCAPGWTVAHEGIPRLPYNPGTKTDGVFYHADKVLFTLPPAYFYWQAPWHWLMPTGLPAGRWASMSAGAGAIVFLYLLGRRLYGGEFVGLAAAGLWSMSRLFFFQAIHARPDMLCTMFCLAALWCMTRWRDSRRGGWPLAAGALSGLAVLSHPFGVVSTVQIGIWGLLGGRTIRERAATVAASAAGWCLAMALWLPLILAYPEEFRVQFLNNVVNPAAPGLVERFVLVWPVLVHQFKYLVALARPIQLAIVIGGMMVATLADVWRPSGRRVALALAWSAYYLLHVSIGTHHIFMYWCLPGALAMLCVARSCQLLGDWLGGRAASRAGWVRGVAVAALVLAMLPGFGLRAFATHVMHWGEEDYDRRRFVQKVLADLPDDAVLLVDQPYVFDVWLAGRKCRVLSYYFQEYEPKYDYMLLGRQGLDMGELRLIERFGGEKVGQWGQPGQEFSHYLEAFEAPPSARPGTAQADANADG